VLLASCLSRLQADHHASGLFTLELIDQGKKATVEMYHGGKGEYFELDASFFSRGGCVSFTSELNPEPEECEIFVLMLLFMQRGECINMLAS
jgi:hypothetical protein